jgi:DNA-binding transcriptional LysR family regulator
MHWHDLQAFIAVADLGSFSRAGERLHLTQPAVSKRVQALEAQLGVRLLDRIGKQVYLTDAGRLLKPRAEDLIRSMQETQRMVQDMEASVSGVLSLATSHHVGLHRLAPILRAFTQRFPEVNLDIRFEDSENAHDMVRRVETEIAVVTLNPLGDPDLHYQLLWDDPLCFVASKDHELATRGPLTLQDLAASTPVLPGLDTYTGRIVVDAFSAAGIPLTPNLATNYLETIAMLVSIGLGWSVLPSSMIKAPLLILNTEAPALRRSLGCVTNPRRTLSNAARAFRDVLQAYADPVGT